MAKTTHRNTWKRFERIVASFFGTKRTPLSGGNSGHTRSDTLHPDLFIEAKFREKHTIYTLFEDTKAKAKIEKKIPLVVLKEKGKAGFLIVCEMKDLCTLAELKNLVVNKLDQDE